MTPPPGLLPSRRALGLGLAALAGMGCATPVAAPDRNLVQPFSPSLQAKRFAGRSQPFVIRFTRGGRSLVFVAAQHSIDAEGATFMAVRRAFAQTSPAVLIVEGFPTERGENPASIVRLVAERHQPEADSYARGEAAFAISLALEAGIPFLGGEPTDKALLAAQVGEGFQPDDIQFITLIKVLGQDVAAGVFAGPSDPRFPAAFRTWDEILAADSGRSITSPELFAVWYQRTFGRALETDPSWLSRADPGGAGLGAAIARSQSLLRDRHLFDVAMAQVQTRQRVLIVYGASHLAALWGAFAHVLGEPAFIV